MVWIDNNIDFNNYNRKTSYRGYKPSEDFDSYTYELYLNFAGFDELELDIVNYDTMLKIWRYTHEN